MEAVEQFPLDAQLLVALGGYLQALEQPQLAARAYDVAFRHGQTEAQIWHLPDIREIAAVCAAAIHQLQGNDDEARSLLEAAARSFPESIRLGRQLIELHIKAGRGDEALAAAGALPLLPPDREAYAMAVRGTLLAQQGKWGAALAQLKTAHEAGCQERFCQRWLIVANLSAGDTASATAILTNWRTADPLNPELADLEQAIAEQTAVADGSSTREHILRLDAPAGVTRQPTAPSGAAQAVTRNIRD